MHNAAAQSAPAEPTLPDGPGKAIILKSCTTCHDAQQATSKPGTADEWTQTVNDMLSKGADLSDDDVTTVVQYLAAHFGPASKPATAAQPPADKASPSGTTAADSSSTPVNVNKADAQELESSLGLSAAEANAIIQYRQQHGDFKTWQEVSSVPGVAADKIKSNQKRLVF
jgi:competence ComEA-like helix-hairpin-helix protein